MLELTGCYYCPPETDDERKARRIRELKRDISVALKRLTIWHDELAALDR